METRSVQMVDPKNGSCHVFLRLARTGERPAFSIEVSQAKLSSSYKALISIILHEPEPSGMMLRISPCSIMDGIGQKTIFAGRRKV